MLICYICGKRYAYESKICKQCEDHAIRSGLLKRDVSINNFLVSNNFRRFGKVEHHELRIEQPPIYDWNYSMSTRVLGFNETEPNFMNALELPMESKAYSSLIFE